jgi:GDP-mannose transporter
MSKILEKSGGSSHNLTNGKHAEDMENQNDSLVIGKEDPGLEKLADKSTLEKWQAGMFAKMTGPVAFGVILYALCSSTLLVINKVAMYVLPDAPFILFCQFLTTTLTVRVLKCARPDMDIELLNWTNVKPFAIAVLVFYMCLLANTRALKSVNVETVIVVRSCSPIAVVLLEHFWLKRDLPSWQGGLALLAIAGGSAVYVLADKGFQIDGYAWLGAYFVFICIEMVYIKFVLTNVPMSTWTRVYYNNTLSLPLAMLSAVAMGENKFMQIELDETNMFNIVSAVGLSCVVAVAISYAGFNLRNLVSATTFTIIGVMCKLGTVLINDLIWTQHSTSIGHLGLLVCILAGFVYEKVKNMK